MFTRTTKTAAVLSALALTLTACGNDGDGDDAEAAGEDQNAFTIGVANEHEAHRELERIAEEELGYDIDLVNFTTRR